MTLEMYKKKEKNRLFININYQKKEPFRKSLQICNSQKFYFSSILN